MKKRFTDSDKWQGWFRKLPPILKVLWEYLRDNCDCAGVWKVDKEKAKFDIGGNIPWEKVPKHFNSRIYEFEDGEKWYLTGFIEFQYGNILNPKNNAHKGVIGALERHKIRSLVINKENILLTAPNEGLLSPYGGAQDKDKEKDMDKDMDKGKEVLWKVESIYPDFKNVKLSEEEYGKLVLRFSISETRDMIENLSLYIGSKGDKYKSHYQTLLNWKKRKENKNIDSTPLICRRCKKKVDFLCSNDLCKPCNKINRELQEQ